MADLPVQQLRQGLTDAKSRGNPVVIARVEDVRDALDTIDRLTATDEALGQEVEEHIAEIVRLARQVDRLTVRCQTAEAVIDWLFDGTDDGYCTCCNWALDQPHAPGCPWPAWRALASSAEEEETT